MSGQSLPAIFVFSFILAIGGVISPGPVSTAIVSQAPRQGWRVGPLIALGHALLELLVVIALAFGLQAVLAQSWVQTAVALMGGALLLWMGARLLLGAWQGQLQLAKAEEGEDQHRTSQLVWLGVATTLANPFWFAWWISVPTSYLAQASALGLMPLAAFYLGHISADFAWDSALAGLVGSGRSWMNQRIYSGILGLCGAFLFYLGLIFFAEGFRLLSTF